MVLEIDIADQTFVVAERATLARELGDPARWRAWWPRLRLAVVDDRGLDGIRWSVAGELAGTAEIWLEGWHDGVIVHWFLRARGGRSRGGSAARVRRQLELEYKRRILALKDDLERARPAGVPRAGGTR